MADTTYMKTEVENCVRDWLAQQFSGKQFSKQILKLTTGGNHEFDAVSQDESIVAGITGHSWKTKGGNLPSGKYAGLYQELYFLSLVKATKRLLILTHQEMYEDFLNRSQGKVAEGINIVFCQLPQDIREGAANIQRQASKEQK